MKIAVPVANGRLFPHFGHCESFELFDIAADGKTIVSVNTVIPPPHEPGILPPWLAKQQATHILSGGMGGRAIELFKAHGVEVVLGVPEGDPRELVLLFLDGRLKLNANACDH